MILDGLVPCIAQDALTGRVLMMAWMDQDAFDRTIATGQMHYFSRSRQKLWRKGETSGHTQRLVALSHDCDEDTLLALVEQTGPACHTGTRTCFTGRSVSGRAAEPILGELADVIEQRKNDAPEASWTSRLLTEAGLAASKVTEEAAEVVAAAGGEGDDTLAHEVADLWYHSLVLAVREGVSLEDILAELAQRRG